MQNKTFKPFFFGFLTAVPLLLVLHSFTVQKKETKAALDNGKSIPQLENEIAKLRRENKQLRVTSSPKEYSEKCIPQKDIEITTETDFDHPSSNEKLFTEEEVKKIISSKEEVDELIDWISSGAKADNNFDYVKSLSKQFDEEAEDSYSSANNYENKIYNLFLNEDKLAELALHEVSCKKRRCQLKLFVDGSDQANNTAEKLYQALNDNKITQSGVTSALDTQTNTLDLYFNR